MCRSFEEISGRKNKGDKSLLEGLTKMYRDAGLYIEGKCDCWEADDVEYDRELFSIEIEEE